MEVKWKNGFDSPVAFATQHPWKATWQIPAFKRKVFIGTVLLVGVLSYLPVFFQHIEMRNGYVLHDFVLQVLPAVDVSIPIFLLIWALTLYTVFRATQHPDIFIRLMYGFVFVCISRLVTIYLVALNPPPGLIPLRDPLANAFYGKAGFITKDLFYSGHTASMCLLTYCLQGRREKIFAGIAAGLVGTLLLVQHVHYTIDVVTAPVLTYACYQLAARLPLVRRPLLRRIA